jgi:hypothetical protein
MKMLPKEHGAYGQMIMPVVTSFVVAGVSTPAVLLAVTAVAGFLVHEPLLVMLGRRGGRAKRELKRRAIIWVAVTTAVMAATGLASAWSMQRGLRWSLMLPLVPAVVLVAAIVAQREKEVVAEVVVALAFSLVAIPVCLAAGTPFNIGVAVAAVFAVVFVTGTLAVRLIVVAVRGGGNPRAARVLRSVVLVLTSSAVLTLATAALGALLPWAALIASAPGLAAASWLALFPPSPTRLRTVGWTLVATSGAGALILIVGLPNAP